MQSAQKERRSPALSQPVLLWSEAMFPNWAQLNDHASVMKAWNEGGGSLGTKSLHYFQCLIYIDFKPNPASFPETRDLPGQCFLFLPLGPRTLSRCPGDRARGSYQLSLLSPPSLSSQELCAPSSCRQGRWAVCSALYFSRRYMLRYKPRNPQIDEGVMVSTL